MAEPVPRATEETAAAPRPPGSRAKRAAFAALFGLILLIPRMRRLRRRPAAWACVRLAALGAGAWLLWRFAHTHFVPGAGPRPGASSLLFGLALAAFGLLVRARPETRLIDSVARELDALVVLNGGSFAVADGAKPVPQVSVYVCADRLVVLTPEYRRVEEIPFSAVRELSACALPAAGRSRAAAGWQLEVRWASDRLRAAQFVFGGFFAEHLARVAEQTIASQWKKSLPVVNP